MLVYPERLSTPESDPTGPIPRPDDVPGEPAGGVDRPEPSSCCEREQVRRGAGSAGVAAHGSHRSLVADLCGDLDRSPLPDLLLHELTVARCSVDVVDVVALEEAGVWLLSARMEHLQLASVLRETPWRMQVESSGRLRAGVLGSSGLRPAERARTCQDLRARPGLRGGSPARLRGRRTNRCAACGSAAPRRLPAAPRTRATRALDGTP